MTKFMLAAGLLALLPLAGCEKSAPTPAGAAAAATVADRIGNAATHVQEIAAEAYDHAGPTVHFLGEKTREGVHAAAAWVEEHTRSASAQ